MTNYVLFELGQPLHAFDRSSIKGSKVIVGRLPKGSGFTTLDGLERPLDGDELMICNGEKAGMCMAGVLGGSDSGVDEETRDLFLESACFDPTTIRNGGFGHGISTEASFRFERGVDPEITRFALERAAALILQLAGGELASEISDTRPEGFEWAHVAFDHQRIAEQVGESIEKERVEGILKALEMEFEDEGTVRVPPYRVDVTREADLLEEILRIHGYDRIPLPDGINASISHTPPEDMGKVRRSLSELLASDGFHELLSNSLVHSEKGEQWHDEQREVRLKNPISSELDVLRQSLLHSALPVIAHNIKRKESELRFFEFGKVYWKGKDGYGEEERLGLYLTGRKDPENWRNRKDGYSFYDLKGFVQKILERCGVFDRVQLRQAERGELQEAFSFMLDEKKGIPLVDFGLLDPDIAKEEDIDQELRVAEFRLAPLFELMRERELHYRPISKHLPVRKDMAFIVDKGRRFEELRRTAFEAEQKLLQEVDLFDLYEGDRIGEGNRSYALKFIFHDPSRTLKDKDIEKAMQRISDSMKEELGAELRDH